MKDCTRRQRALLEDAMGEARSEHKVDALTACYCGLTRQAAD